MSLENLPSSLGNFSETKLAGEEKHSYRFKSFELKPFERQLLHDGHVVPLTPKAFEILIILVENAGHLVKKEEIMESVWPDAFVEEANLARLVHTLRKTLGEDEDGNRFIETVAKQGYRFVAEVTKEAESVEDDVWPDVVAVTEEIDVAVEPATGHRPLLLVGLGAVVTLTLIAVLSLTWTGGEADAGTASIAVLPFRAANRASRDEDIDLALADELINQLSQSKDLKVRSFSIISKYASSDLDPSAIGDQQKVAYVLVSNYFVDGDRVKGTSELYNTATGTIDATFPFDGTNTKRFALVETIASSIRPRLLASLNVDQLDVVQRHGTKSQEAWRSYLHGMNLANTRSVENARKAIPYFENAIRLDPNWARGYVGLTHAFATVLINGGGDVSELCTKQIAALERALEIDPTDGEAHSLFGGTKQYCSWDVPSAMAVRRRSIALSPNSGLVRRYYAVNIMNFGRFDEALEHLTVAREIDPGSSWNEKLVGRVLFFARRYDEAIAQSIKAMDLDPEPEQTRFVYMAYELKGDVDNAMEWFLKVESLKKGTTEEELAVWRNIYAEAGWQGVLKRRLELAVEAEKRAELPEVKANCYAQIATLAIQLGDYEKAFPYLEKAVFSYPLFAAQLKIDPYLDPVRTDPRYADLLARTWDRVANYSSP